jgi:hypothetical protein
MPQRPGRIVAKEVRGVMLAVPSSVGMAVDGLHRLPLNGVPGEVLPEAAMGQALYSDAAARIPDGQALPRPDPLRPGQAWGDLPARNAVLQPPCHP